jgi:hypothetical protein
MSGRLIHRPSETAPDRDKMRRPTRACAREKPKCASYGIDIVRRPTRACAREKPGRIASGNDAPSRPTRACPREKPARDASSAGAASEAKMLAVLGDSRFVTKTISEKARAAGVSRATWYRRKKDPLFSARAGAACRKALNGHLGPVLAALSESAATPAHKNFLDRKLFLELVGMYPPEPGSILPVSCQGLADVDAMSDEELLKVFEGAEHRLPPGLRRRMGYPCVDGSLRLEEPTPATCWPDRVRIRRDGRYWVIMHEAYTDGDPAVETVLEVALTPQKLESELCRHGYEPIGAADEWMWGRVDDHPVCVLP